jgi:hypothetical protein
MLYGNKVYKNKNMFIQTSLNYNVVFKQYIPKKEED